MTIDQERKHIQKAIEALTKTLGQRPLGWYCRYGFSVNTRDLLVEEGGFLYDSNAYNDELPYWVMVQKTPHLVIPYTLTNNDTKFVKGFFGGEDFFIYVRDCFDLLYREGQT